MRGEGERCVGPLASGVVGGFSVWDMAISMLGQGSSRLGSYRSEGGAGGAE